jgi:hypothetical protein
MSLVKYFFRIQAVVRNAILLEFVRVDVGRRSVRVCVEMAAEAFLMVFLVASGLKLAPQVELRVYADFVHLPLRMVQ